MEKKQRLTGIDLLRGLAIYAVVILHSDEGILVQPVGWSAILHFSSFAVPFFLATSFYLIFSKAYSQNKFHFSWRSRLTRLLIPYIFWSAIYLAYKIFKFLTKNEIDKLVALLQDPISIIFFGGSAFHLYFIPLLLIGCIFVKFTELLVNKRINLNSLFLLFAISITTYNLLLIYGSSFQIGVGFSFQKFSETISYTGAHNLIMRIFLGELAWLIRCLPYIFIAMILNHPRIKKSFDFNSKTTIFLFFSFLLINSFGNLIFPESIYEVTRGYAALLFAISLSTALKDTQIVANLGASSFGIYLIHLLVVEIFQSLAQKVYTATEMQVSTLSLLLFSIVSFLVSWILVYLLMKNKALSKLMFGS